MDSSELHYITYDAEEMWLDMNMAYIDAGGEVLYPGDEKEMLLRGVQNILMLAFAGVDNALRMATLRYAQRDYLKIYGEGRGCPYIEATKATATIEIVFKATGRTDTLEAGEAVTVDGEMLYLLDEDVSDTGAAQTVTVGVTCAIAGSAGNGLLAGMQMQPVLPHDGIYSIYTATNASGGQDGEDFEDYRERIRTYGLTSVTTGPAEQYEARAMAVSSVILDAHAISPGNCQVLVYLLLSDISSSAAIIAAVDDALSPQSVRPLTDSVTVLLATPLSYTLNVKYQVDADTDATALEEAAASYQKWQDQTIGQPFNPDKLMAMLYQAGATRVIWDAGSTFNGGDVEYTTIAENEYCSGTINLAVIQ